MITDYTGFKWSGLARTLFLCGAIAAGYSLYPPGKLMEEKLFIDLIIL
jgi:hypothetical protein